MFWQLVQANWQDFRYFLCDLVTELMRYMGSRGHMIFPFIEIILMIWDVCHSHLCSHVAYVAFHDDIQYILFVWFYLQVWMFYSDTITLSFNSLSHLFTFNGLRTTWRWFFPPFWIGNFKLMAIQGKSPAYPSGLVITFPTLLVEGVDETYIYVLCWNNVGII